MVKTPKFSNLFESITLNDHLTLKNRIIMAPLTRAMASEEGIPSKLSSEYYTRRADAGLIISEGLIIRADGRGYPQIPGIFNKKQVDAWKNITSNIHAHSGKIFAQLWHVGRVSHPDYLNGNQPIAPSAIALEGRIPRSKDLQYGMPRSLEVAEIKELIENYAQAAKRAMDAGFDGIELHAANGYLIDQFLHYHTNRRNDPYGGDIYSMIRFPLEIIDRCIDAIGHQRIGIRLSPAAYFNMDPNPNDRQVFDRLLEHLEQRNLAYVHAGIFDDHKRYDYLDGQVSEYLRSNFRGTLIGNGGYSPEQATKAIQENKFDLISFGRLFIANPDLIEKIKTDAELTPYDASMLTTLV